MKSTAHSIEMVDIPDRIAVEGKGSFVKVRRISWQSPSSWRSTASSGAVYDWEGMTRPYTYATGIQMTVEDLKTNAMCNVASPPYENQ